MGKYLVRFCFGHIYPFLSTTKSSSGKCIQTVSPAPKDRQEVGFTPNTLAAPSSSSLLSLGICVPVHLGAYTCSSSLCQTSEPLRPLDAVPSLSFSGINLKQRFPTSVSRLPWVTGLQKNCNRFCHKLPRIKMFGFISCFISND